MRVTTVLCTKKVETEKMQNNGVQYFTRSQYKHLKDYCRCYCGHRRKLHDYTQKCLKCDCERYGRRTEWVRGRKPTLEKELEDIGEPAQEHTTCMFFDDTSDAPDGCIYTGQNVGTIEVPLWVVDATWRSDITRALKFDNALVKPAAHYFERGCYLTMPLVLCLNHRRQMLGVNNANKVTTQA
jgi:hypothetical protein